MWKANEGSTTRLIQLCLGYYVFYVITGVTVKYFLGPQESGLPGYHGIQFLVFSTLGGTAVCLAVSVACRWYRLQSIRPITWAGVRFPSELLYIVPSGICTAVVIPTTTLMYTLPISVMVAMVMMRGSVIVVSRVVDAIQIRQGILHKRVYREENIAVVFALTAVATKVLWTPSVVNSLVGAAQGVGLGIPDEWRLEPGGGRFEFLGSPVAMSILGSYVVAYSIRIYIMNYYKNTRAKGQKLDNKAFFAIEQIAASATLVLATILVFNAPALLGWDIAQIDVFRGAIVDPPELWGWAVLAGTAFGIVAFFSVFIFMFKGRTATFAGLVNRLTSLVAGITATLFFHYAFGGRFPSAPDWISLAFIFVAVFFLTKAERMRAAELARIADEAAQSPTTVAAASS